MAEPDAFFADAERLVREAQSAAEQAARAVPPRGWARAGGDAPPAAAFPDLAALSSLLGAVRGSLPPELARQLADALRELLIAVRAILDYSIARLERSSPEPVRVEDIPVD